MSGANGLVYIASVAAAFRFCNARELSTFRHAFEQHCCPCRGQTQRLGSSIVPNIDTCVSTFGENVDLLGPRSSALVEAKGKLVRRLLRCPSDVACPDATRPQLQRGPWL
jgi:hypothetical protein